MMEWPRELTYELDAKMEARGAHVRAQSVSSNTKGQKRSWEVMNIEPQGT